MAPTFREALADSGRFVITLELVPGPESRGLSVETVKAIASDALKDGRISAVSITDNPGGHPALSPDVLGREIQDLGMDVIVHCTCRDLNRAGLESRALQLGRMGLRNILALTGDYSGRGFGGQALPVFDLDAVTLLCLLRAVGERTGPGPSAERFYLGCAVSPFKQTEAECCAQYAKLRLKCAVGAEFVITQLGYDARKFQEVLQVQRRMGLQAPALATVYVLTPGAARRMHDGKVPGAVVTQPLLDKVAAAESPADFAIEQAARLAAVLKGLGYRGIHLGGIHRSFQTADRILSRLDKIDNQWQDFLPEFDHPQPRGYYAFQRDPRTTHLSSDEPSVASSRCGAFEKAFTQLMERVHQTFFRLDAPLSSMLHKWAAACDRSRLGRFLFHVVEDPAKWLLFRCERCGDCAIHHLGYLCPESQCPKNIRNGPCGGSAQGKCEVYPDRPCVYVRAYNRLAAAGRADALCARCVPPRMWELNKTSSWLNFHLRRDHESLTCEIARLFPSPTCPHRDGQKR